MPATETISNYIGGQWTKSSATESQRVINPATEDKRTPTSQPLDFTRSGGAFSPSFKFKGAWMMLTIEKIRFS